MVEPEHVDPVVGVTQFAFLTMIPARKQIVERFGLHANGWPSPASVHTSKEGGFVVQGFCGGQFCYLNGTSAGPENHKFQDMPY
ncbi:MAG: hypothetical protein JRN20_21730 [Nitrososphaerota archaeon]|nr:hypothetical protein [Nitrososphaerota archaeon]MDG6921915.1 hypothetical protein [Nitrososphaerota archaeon]